MNIKDLDREEDLLHEIATISALLWESENTHPDTSLSAGMMHR